MGLSALAAGDAAAFLSGMNPSLFTIRTFRTDWASNDQTKNDIRVGTAIGNVLAFMVGFGASAVSESWWPLAMTVAVMLILDCAYEWALRVPRASQ